MQAPGLITSPINPIFNSGNFTFPDSSMVAELYANDDNHFLGESSFVTAVLAYLPRIALPGSSLN